MSREVSPRGNGLGEELPEPTIRTTEAGFQVQRVAAALLPILLALAPVAYCLLRGCMRASLWLDEILYFHYEHAPEIRAIEMGQPGSLWPRLLGNFAYCDLQRGIHVLFDATGLHLRTAPELYLRLPALLSFVLSMIVLYRMGLRARGDRLWAAGVALAFGSTPIFLFYAFEARVYSFAALLLILFVGFLGLVLDGNRGRTLLFGIMVGSLAVWTQLWSVCFLAGVAACLPLLVWRDPEHWRKGARVALLIAPGLLLIAIEAAYVFSVRVPGRHGIPLFEPQPLMSVFYATIYGPFLGLLRGDPEYVLGILLAICLFRGRGRLSWLPPAAAWIALALSVVLMNQVGFGISPRHQTALYATVFACLALTKPGLLQKALLANLIGLNLVLIPATIGRIQDKGNAKQLSQVIGSSPRLRQFPVVVQHSYAMGYPDPLHSFPLAVYLNQTHPGEPPVRLLELPTHREVRDLLLARVYFLEGESRLPLFTAEPVDQWVAFLENLPDRALWLVVPTNSPAGVRQDRRYESALKQAGFSKVPGFPREFYGYPTTKLILWKRTERPR